MQILDKLQTMPPEEGVELMKRLFNPMKGAHVGYSGDKHRSEDNALGESKQDKSDTQTQRRFVGSVATPTGCIPLYFGDKEARGKSSEENW